MMSILIDFVVAMIANLLVVCLISLIYNLIKNKTFRNFPFRLNFIIALIWTLIIVAKDYLIK